MSALINDFNHQFLPIFNSSAGAVSTPIDSDILYYRQYGLVILLTIKTIAGSQVLFFRTQYTNTEYSHRKPKPQFSAVHSSMQPFILAYFWLATICKDTHNERAEGCKYPLAYWKDNLTLHGTRVPLTRTPYQFCLLIPGLWPQNLTASHHFPEYCTEEKFNRSIVNELGSYRMTKLWPDVQLTPENNPANNVQILPFSRYSM